ncbi:MAG: transcriptional regulator, LuxR family, partial [Solirubrobacterales bacterium]|nr:transcriptional regulator, LuxR family [Solirubrobacterales bacterium]
YLERALDEPPIAEDLVDVLVELGVAEAAAGRGGAAARLADAVVRAEDPGRRAAIQRIRGHTLYVQGRHREAAAAFDAGLDELDGSAGELASELQAGYVAAATIDPELRASALARAESAVAHLTGPLAPGDRALLAQTALHRTLAAAPRDEVRALALRAWDGGSLLADETAAGFNWTLVTGAFDFTDELELSLDVCEAAMKDARRLGSPLAFATASYERSIPLYYQGRIAEAATDAQAALDATRFGWHMYARSAAYTLALCQIERDELDAAETTLSILDDEPAGTSIEHPALLDARGVLRLRQGRADEALADHLEAGRLFTEVFGVLTTGDVAWRLGAAEAAFASGDRGRALALAAEELEFSRRVGLTRGVLGALRVLGLAEGGERGLALLTEAVAMPEPAPARLEHLRALVDLGAALRRANRRVESREPLRRGLEAATVRGASRLAKRARTELEATGARPRKVILSGPEALTASERRVAELAASGATNRQIAQALFVTGKTVEFHLRHAFRKLGVSSRHELAAALPRPA